MRIKSRRYAVIVFICENLQLLLVRFVI